MSTTATISVDMTDIAAAASIAIRDAENASANVAQGRFVLIEAEETLTRDEASRAAREAMHTLEISRATGTDGKPAYKNEGERAAALRLVMEELEEDAGLTVDIRNASKRVAELRAELAHDEAMYKLAIERLRFYTALAGGAR